MLVALALFLAASPVSSVRVEGDLIKPAALTVEDLKAMGPITVDWSDKSGAHRMTGVRLDVVLLKLGFTEGPTGPAAKPKQKHEGLRAIVIASAGDGFEAVFSLGELLETLGATTALLAWEQDGKPLPAAQGPFRLVVPTDKKGSRSLYQLTSLRVTDVKTK